MKNYLKMTLFAGLFILSILAISNVQAQSYTYSPASSSYTDITDSVSYNEDIIGENRGFSIKHTSTVPRDQVISGCDYYDWTSDYRKCRRTSRYNNNNYKEDYSYSIYDRYHYDNYRAPYNQDKAVELSFKTFQKSTEQQTKLETLRINSRNNRRYGGYGSGYSRYSFGW